MPANKALFELAFRPKFLGASALSVAALGIWLAQLNGWLAVGGAISPAVWHAEQMIFGFGAAVAVGFLLTAVQNWTNLPSLSGRALVAVMALWLSARAALLLNQPGWVELGVWLQGLWWLAVIGSLGYLIWRADNRRNFVMVVMLTLLASLNFALLVLDLNGRGDLALHLARTSMLLFGLLMSLIGGRVIPLFTRAGLAREGIQLLPIEPWKWLELSLPLVSVLGIGVFFLGKFVALPLSPAWLMIAAGLLHTLRLVRWQGWKTSGVSLLWSLHLSYLMLALGMLSLGASYWIEGMRFTEALHLITVGAMGLMIVSMMSRVSLGHTGRTLAAANTLSVAFALMLLAALARGLLPLMSLRQWGWNISGALWLASMGIFLTVYLPVLTSPRQEN